jgi:hypothetical protein
VVATNPHSCTATSTSVELIFSGPPQVNFTGLLSSYCLNETPPTILTGSPAGGTFSGYGVTGTDTVYFDPTNLMVAGPDTITYSYTDSVTGCSNSIYYVTDLMICDGISENPSLHLFSLYPNPNSGDFTLKLYIANDGILKAEVIDVIGKTIYSEDIHADAGIHAVPMNLQQLSKGIYSLRISGSNGSVVKRFVIE